jgi:hypothetical protein
LLFLLLVCIYCLGAAQAATITQADLGEFALYDCRPRSFDLGHDDIGLCGLCGRWPHGYRRKNKMAPPDQPVVWSPGYPRVHCHRCALMRRTILILIDIEHVQPVIST